MELAVDLHAHSVFAGGAQALKLTPERRAINRKKAINYLMNANKTMPLKGIDLIGTGDCQFYSWMDILRGFLQEDTNGVYLFERDPKIRFILQTEIIFTGPIKKWSKVVHIVILFPNFSSIETFRELLEAWNVKQEKMARPFVKCITPEQISERIFKIMDIDPWVEIIPAHVMTPQGIYGSRVRVNYLKEFFGSVAPSLRVFETGLSADPKFLALIPELDERVLISSSDAHSSALHRMGREFTVLSVSKLDYPNIISALRKNQISYTMEFPPEEGKFFLTGHRPGRKSPGLHGQDEYCCFSPQYVPVNDICPICTKTLTIGVFQRCVEISKAQGADREITNVKTNREFIHMVPLIDIISQVLNVKTKSAKSVINKYHQIVNLVGSERNLWQVSYEDIENKLHREIETPLLKAILQIKSGNFTFFPYGYDGVYGNLTIGRKGDYNNVKVIKTSKPLQLTL